MMRKQTKKWMMPLMLLACLGLISAMVSCGEDNPEPPSTEPEVSGFSPAEGRVGTRVSILGKNFSSEVSAINVSFNGTEASVVSANESLIVAEVPAGATSGTISVSVFGSEATSSESFSVSASHSLTEVTPSIGEAGDQVTIIGSNFGSDQSEISVSFTGSGGDVEAVVVSASDTEIVVVVPDGGSTGPVKVQVGPEAIESSFIFTFPFFGFDNEFVEDAEGWTSDASLSLSDEALVVDFGGGSSASLSYAGEILFNPDKFPILAIRMTRLAEFGLTLETTLGTFGDGENAYTGIIDGDIYFYDLTEGDYLTAETLITSVEFAVTKTSAEENFSVQWIRSFESISALKSYDPFPAGKYLWEFDNDFEDERLLDWLPSGAPYTIANSQISVEFPQTTGKRRADLYHVIQNTFPIQGGFGDPANNLEGNPNHPYNRDNVVLTKDYPIIAIKFGTRDLPPVGRNTDDQVLGAIKRDFAFGFQVSDDVTNASTSPSDRLYYWNNYDATVPGGKAIPEDEPMAEYSIFTFKIADFDPAVNTGDLSGYDVDWIGTFESVEALNAYNARFE